jgi:hypothetical protein
MTDRVAAAVAAGDLDALVRLVDGLCSARDWDEVVRLRDRCRQALERGLQLWPAAEYAEYRLALEAPASYAGPVVRVGAGRFALGPLWEVAASTRSWETLSPHLSPGPARGMAAHERVVRGEDLGSEPEETTLVLDIPARLEPWEPSYPTATYYSDRADFPAPPAPAMTLEEMSGPGTEVEDEGSVEALLELGRVWAEQSNGDCSATAVEGEARAAIAALGHRRARVAEIGADAALAWMCWAGASGGAYGRRPGTPAGRFAAWWAGASLAGLDWPPEPADLGAALAGMHWLLWEPEGHGGGWAIHLAAHHRGEGLAWAVAATDTHRDDDPDRPRPAAGE